jgi:hypothetical protein
MRTLPLYFIDYTISLDPNNNIQFDPELDKTKLCVEEGELFKVETIDNKITFVRQNV